MANLLVRVISSGRWQFYLVEGTSDEEHAKKVVMNRYNRRQRAAARVVVFPDSGRRPANLKKVKA